VTLGSGRRLTAKRPNHVLHVDLTTVPISRGFWASWIPFAVPQRWPHCWWVAVALDHYSRRVMGVAVFERLPSSLDVRRFLGRMFHRENAVPKYIITDQGKQFRARGFKRWCRRRGIVQRFGAVDKYGSLAVIERFIRTMKDECTRRILVDYRREAFANELSLFVSWYNHHRPNAALGGRTPDEVYRNLAPRCTAPRFETRPRWPRESRSASPDTRVRGHAGIHLELTVRHLEGRRHLPIVSLRRAA
jgi:putative transposase